MAEYAGKSDKRAISKMNATENATWTIGGHFCLLTFEF
jgi:hypothetical protein